MDDKTIGKLIRESEVMGIPGDIVAHFVIGALIGWIVYMVFGSDRKAIAFIFIISIAKEVFFDLYANIVQGLIFEPIKDITISVLGAFLILTLARKPFAKKPRSHHSYER